MVILDQFSKREKQIILASTVMLVVCSVLFFDDRWTTSMRISDSPGIGKIKHQENDARLKPNNQFVWFKSKGMEKIHIGDSVFAGEKSVVQVGLDKGGEITVGENSLVVFRDLGNEKLANLEMGNFRLKIDGEIKVAVKGQVTTLSGDNSEVQVYLGKDQKPKLKLLKGKATIKAKNKPPVELDQVTVAEVEPERETKSPASIPAPPEVPTDLSKVQEVTYNWRLYDIYRKKDFELFDDAKAPELVEAKALLSWASRGGRSASVEISSASDFVHKSSIESKLGSAEVSPVYLGENFWRVSLDGKNWSDIQKFVVRGLYRKDSIPVFKKKSDPIPLISKDVNYPIVLESTSPALGFVVQASTNADFRKESTRAFWTSSSKFNVAFYHPGNYFYRFRHVSQNQELSDWSDVAEFKVFSPDLPSAPVLRNAKRTGFVGDEFVSTWKASGGSSIFIELTNEKNEIVNRMNGPKGVWKPVASGQYQVRAYGLNKYGQVGPPSKPLKLEVKDKPQPIAISKPKEIPKRKTASVENTSSLKVPEIELKNVRYSSSLLSVEGFLWTLQSSQQYYASQQAPTATGIGVRGLKWWGSSGLEASLKSSMIGLNSSGGSSSVKDFEARYHYRFYTGFPFSWTRELQISFFGGAEFYRNSGDMYVNRYDLLKFGTSLEFPWSQRWGGGGEFVGGIGRDGSLKEEVSGHFTYYLRKEWSFGMGYRLHLFQAGSSSSAPGGFLPYKEGYTEGYSILNYHF